MMEQKVVHAFFIALRAGLWSVKPDRNVFRSLTNANWLALYQLSVNQTVDGIIADVIQGLDTEVLPPKALWIKWMVRLQQLEYRNAWMNGIIAEQLDFFSKHGLQPVLLKGQGLTAFYDQPLHRVCGDIDWYFADRQEYKRANGLLENKGIKVARVPGYSVCYTWKGCVVEHHQRMFDIHNPFCSRYLKKLEREEMIRHIMLPFQGETLIIPAPILNTIQVNVHILKHLLGYGIGVRQLCDAARLYEVLHKEIDGAYLKSVYQALGILHWVTLLHVLLVDYLGLEKSKLPFQDETNEDVRWMLNDILAAGNFGFHHGYYQAKPGQAGINRTGRAKQLWYSFRRYVRLAPMEAISFPIVQLLSRIQH